MEVIQLSKFNEAQRAAITDIQPACWKAIQPATDKYHEAIYRAERIKNRATKEAVKERARQTFFDETDEVIKPYLADLAATGLFTEEELTQLPL